MNQGLRRMLTVVVGLAAAAAALWLLIVALLWWQQERLLFLPTPLAADHRFEFGADVHEVWVEVPGARLNALHLRNPKPRGVVFFLHGNAGNLQSWAAATDFYRQQNFDMFMLDYRGYGKSTGRIESQAQLEADVRAAWQGIASQYSGLRRVIAGRSLGTGLAAILSAEVQPEVTLLISPYQSMLALMQDHYAWVPGAVLRYPLRTDESLARVKSAIVLVHGQVDALIGVHHSQRLLEAAPTARLVQIEQAGHNDLQAFAAYFTALSQAMSGAP
jgi:uncharacterized protein